jgi:hypothetical protein
MTYQEIMLLAEQELHGAVHRLDTPLDKEDHKKLHAMINASYVNLNLDIVDWEELEPYIYEGGL